MYLFFLFLCLLVSVVVFGLRLYCVWLISLLCFVSVGLSLFLVVVLVFAGLVGLLRVGSFVWFELFAIRLWFCLLHWCVVLFVVCYFTVVV